MKLAIIAAAGSLALATPAIACPNHEDATAPKTAEKAKEAPSKKAEAPKANPQPKQDSGSTTAKKKEPAAPKQDADKKPDKVSQK